MTLATHAVVGAVVAQLFPNHPVVAFTAGFCSHFLFDAIPHWDYEILSDYSNPDIAMAHNAQSNGASRAIRMDRAFIKDLMRTGTDVLIGLAIVAVFLYVGFLFNPIVAFIGAISAIFPDFLQLVYNRLPYQPLTALQKFHQKIHAESRPFKDKHVHGIAVQILIVGVTTAVGYLLMLL